MTAAPDAGAYAALYEALRAQMTAGDALGGAPETRARGVALAVLLQGGLPAWLTAVEPMLSILPTETAGRARERAAPVAMQPACTVAPDVLPPALQGEVTLLLAALVLSTARSGHRDPFPARRREGACR